jgi:hypothetical protein
MPDEKKGGIRTITKEQEDLLKKTRLPELNKPLSEVTLGELAHLQNPIGRGESEDSYSITGVTDNVSYNSSDSKILSEIAAKVTPSKK